MKESGQIAALGLRGRVGLSRAGQPYPTAWRRRQQETELRTPEPSLWSRILSGSHVAMAVSVVAALFAWQQVEVARTHNRLSVMPILVLTTHAEGATGRNGIYVSNVGLGPALLTDFSAAAGKTHKAGFDSGDQWPALLRAINLDPACYATGWPKAAAAIKAGDDLPVLTLTRADGAQHCYSDFLKLVAGEGVTLKMGYTSIYGEARTAAGQSRLDSPLLDELVEVIPQVHAVRGVLARQTVRKPAARPGG